jgi:hypothetical protein
MNQKQASIMSIGIIIALSIIPMAFAEGNVEITTHSVEHTAGFFTNHYLASGIIQNTGDQPVDRIQLNIEVRDHGELILNQTFTPAETELAPGKYFI